MIGIGGAPEADDPRRATAPAPQVIGIDVDPVTNWFLDNIDGVRAPLTFAPVAGGRSNLTFFVTDEQHGRYVLRRPPLGHLLPSAHDMRREFRIISALHASAVPVPTALGLCDDHGVNGASFYVMEYVDGLVLRTPDDAAPLNLQQRHRVGESIVDTLVSLHTTDVDAVGLGDLGKRENYVQRQLTRWYRQFTESKTRELPLIDELHNRLLKAVPRQQVNTIVHGDYRLDNTMLDRDGNVIAVLDWEICTLGDPLADLGLLLVYWPEANDPTPPLGLAATMAEGFATKQDLLARYRDRSSLDLSDLAYYTAFGYWKLGCILEGVYTRYATGTMGNDGYDFHSLKITVPHLAQLAHQMLATT